MTAKNLAIIMGAGYGRRMGDIDVPKVMLPNSRGEHFIDDAFTFLSAKNDNLDFAVLSRREPYFKPLNDYLDSHPERDAFSVLYQETKPQKFHVAACIFEYGRRDAFYEKVKNYDNVVLMPGDHNLRASDLDLDNFVQFHEEKNAAVSLVYSKGWSEEKANKDVLLLGDNGRLDGCRRVNPDYELSDNEVKATSTGIWMLKRKPKTLWRLGGFVLHQAYTEKKLTGFYSYFIEDGWGGVRDTPDKIRT